MNVKKNDASNLKLTIRTYELSNQLVPLFLSLRSSARSFSHPLVLFFPFLFPGISAYNHLLFLLSSLLTHPPYTTTTYHLSSADPLTMSQKPNAIIFGWCPCLCRCLL